MISGVSSWESLTQKRKNQQPLCNSRKNLKPTCFLGEPRVTLSVLLSSVLQVPISMSEQRGGWAGGEEGRSRSLVAWPEKQCLESCLMDSFHAVVHLHKCVPWTSLSFSAGNTLGWGWGVHSASPGNSLLQATLIYRGQCTVLTDLEGSRIEKMLRAHYNFFFSRVSSLRTPGCAVPLLMGFWMLLSLVRPSLTEKF